jgi:cardiolipin hydrolase
MDVPELKEHLSRSFLDKHLSRQERQDLADQLRTIPVVAESNSVREFAFELVKQSFKGSTEAELVLQWLDDVTRSIPNEVKPANHQGLNFCEAHFSPGEDCLRAISRRISNAKKSIDLCVFTITDDRLSSLILDAQHRKVRLRIITDNDKAMDEGSDVDRFREVGIEVREDRSPFHMHHKFALFDKSILITGSYNWTRGAARDNQENLIVSSELPLTSAFQNAFDRLWESLR